MKTDTNEILKQFEDETGFSSDTTMNCELTNWLLKKLVEFNNVEKTFTEDEVLRMVDDSFHMFSSNNRHDAKDYVIRTFFNQKEKP